MTKLCQQCGVEFQRKPRTGNAQWERRKFCSHSCARRYLNLQRGVNPVTTRYRHMKGKPEHRLVMERILGRTLTNNEVVHHIDGDRLNNDATNLEVMTLSEHGRHHHPPTHPTEKVCPICGVTFTPHKTKRKRQKTCGRKCGWELSGRTQRHS